jgi:hypothetical protein
MRIELMLRTIPDLPPAAVSGLEAMRVHVRQEAGMVDDLIDAARTLTGRCRSRARRSRWARSCATPSRRSKPTRTPRTS